MKEKDKTKEELLAELEALRQQVAELEDLQNRIKSREKICAGAKSDFALLQIRPTTGKPGGLLTASTFMCLRPANELRGTGARIIADPSLVARIVHPDDQAVTSKHFLEDFRTQGLLHIDFQDHNKNRRGALHQSLLPGCLHERGEWLGARASKQRYLHRKRAEIGLPPVNRALKVLGKIRRPWPVQG